MRNQIQDIKRQWENQSANLAQLVEILDYHVQMTQASRENQAIQARRKQIAAHASDQEKQRRIEERNLLLQQAHQEEQEDRKRNKQIAAQLSEEAQLEQIEIYESRMQEEMLRQAHLLATELHEGKITLDWFKKWCNDIKMGKSTRCIKAFDTAIQEILTTIP